MNAIKCWEKSSLSFFLVLIIVYLLYFLTSKHNCTDQTGQILSMIFVTCTYHINSVSNAWLINITKLIVKLAGILAGRDPFSTHCIHQWWRYETYQTIFLFWCLGHAPGVGLGGARATLGSKIYFLLKWSCGIWNWWEWWVEQNAGKNFTQGSNWWPWGEVRRSNIMKFQFYKVNFKDFNAKLCVLTSKRHKTYQPEFLFCDLGHAPGVGLGDAWGSKTLAWGFAMAPHGLPILVDFFSYF